ncbi:MAG TPA: hypothetical protein PK114_00115 [Smithellaceae bacterium]|nr:hypothetical protein [Smithellaceae bacterium]
MTQEILIALITVAGTALSAFFGVFISGKMVNYRLSELEKKVEKHNTLVERMTRCEGRLDGLERHG